MLNFGWKCLECISRVVPDQFEQCHPVFFGRDKLFNNNNLFPIAIAAHYMIRPTYEKLVLLSILR